MPFMGSLALDQLEPLALGAWLDEILDDHGQASKPEGKIEALVGPHIDLRVGHKVYSQTYSMLENNSPTRVILLGVGHQMADDLFSLADKDFETPFGLVKSDRKAVERLKAKGEGAVSANDFPVLRACILHFKPCHEKLCSRV